MGLGKIVTIGMLGWAGREDNRVNEVEPFDSKNSRSSGSFTGAIDLIS